MRLCSGLWSGFGTLEESRVQQADAASQIIHATSMHWLAWREYLHVKSFVDPFDVAGAVLVGHFMDRNPQSVLSLVGELRYRAKPTLHALRGLLKTRRSTGSRPPETTCPAARLGYRHASLPKAESSALHLQEDGALEARVAMD